MTVKNKLQPETQEQALELAIAALEKKFGKGTIITDKSQFADIIRIPTGSISLDKALNGGYARGRIVEIFGLESAGKTTIALHAIAECQKQGYTCAFIDAEHALDIDYAEAIGVNIEKLLVAQPDDGEQALDIVEYLTRSNALALIVVDSVAALTPRAEILGQMGDTHVGLQARLMSQAMRKLASIVHTNQTTIIFLNQIRMKIGVYYGAPEVTSGGNALKFYASQRLDIRKKDIVSEGHHILGINSQVKVVKNKVGPPFKVVRFNIMFGQGIDWAHDLVTVALDKNMIERKGSWFAYGDRQLGQGLNKAANTVREDTNLAQELRNLILNS